VSWLFQRLAPLAIAFRRSAATQPQFLFGFAPQARRGINKSAQGKVTFALEHNAL
jgi:hypothetical protein